MLGCILELNHALRNAVSGQTAAPVSLGWQCDTENGKIKCHVPIFFSKLSQLRRG